MQVDDTNAQFRRAVSIVNHTDQHLFLTGKAGTGKTTFLKYIREHTFKKLVVVAPTGVAAINAGGVTLHSFFQLPFGTFIANKNDGWNQMDSRVYNTNQLLSQSRIRRKKRDLIRELDLLIIDEISMVRADLLDAVDILLRHIRRRHHEPFGGLQMIFIGDLFQLPPVVKNQDWQLMQPFYEGPFFFNARVIKEAPPIYLELKKIYRQDDPAFITLLNNIRNNCCSVEELHLLDRYYQPDFIPCKEDGYITLTSHNYLADQINRRELDKLSGRTYKQQADLEGDFPESAYPADKVLELKSGAQIMFIKNDKGEDRRYFNGKTGTIQRIEGDKIYIKFPGEQELLELTKETWRNVRYQYDEEKDNVKEKEIGSFRQYPIRLAWAVTIHKSQGLTFNKAIIDAGRAFAAGQVYVALSRLTSLEGLVLRSQITPYSIRTDEKVLQFAKKELPEEELDKTLEEAQKLFLHQSVLSAFNWDRLLIRLDQYQETSTPGQTQSRLLETGWINELKAQLLEQQKVGLKFIPALEKLLQKKTAYPRLHERTQAAVEWFTRELEEKIIKEINKHIQELSAKKRTKKKVRLLQNLLEVFKEKKLQLDQAQTITEGLLQAKESQMLIDAATARYRSKREEAAEPETEKPVKPQKGDSARLSLSLFKTHKNTAEIAKLRELKENTILNHLITFIPAGEISIYELFTPEKVAALSSIIKENPEATSSGIREKSGNGFSYPEIKAVQLYLKKEQ